MKSDITLLSSPFPEPEVRKISEIIGKPIPEMTYAIVCGSFDDGPDGVGTCSYVEQGLTREEAEAHLPGYADCALLGEKYWIVEEGHHG